MQKKDSQTRPPGAGAAGKRASRVGRPMEARLAKQGREMALLRAQLDRYETALRGSSVTVYSQDRDLRYNAISNPVFGHAIADIIGKTDAEILPAAGRDAVIEAKRAALAQGEPVSCEIALGNGDTLYWFDLHVEPLRGDDGEIVGLTGAAVDITDRKQNEAHLRLLMRELTHRSKNLLAVIQAMARQTAKHAGSIDTFLDQFNARLQALSASHDLLVHEGWHGASLEELVRSQLGHYLQGAEPPVTISGPAISLKPDAAQSLGLALHELATNAAKYGALSAGKGRVDIAWRRMPAADGFGVELLWTERDGPPLKPPARSGFGTLVIDRNLSRSLDAEVSLSFEPSGVRCRVAIPVTQVLTGR